MNETMPIILGKFSIHNSMKEHGYRNDFTNIVFDQRFNSLKDIKKLFNAFGRIRKIKDREFNRELKEHIEISSKLDIGSAKDNFVDLILKKILKAKPRISWRTVVFAFMSVGKFAVNCFENNPVLTQDKDRAKAFLEEVLRELVDFVLNILGPYMAKNDMWQGFITFCERSPDMHASWCAGTSEGQGGSGGQT